MTRDEGQPPQGTGGWPREWPDWLPPLPGQPWSADPIRSDLAQMNTPIFSTRRRGDAVVVDPDATPRPGRLPRPVMVALAVALGAAATTLGMLRITDLLFDTDPPYVTQHWWLLVVIAVLILSAGYLRRILRSDAVLRYGQRRTATRLAATHPAAAIAVGCMGALAVIRESWLTGEARIRWSEAAGANAVIIAGAGAVALTWALVLTLLWGVGLASLRAEQRERHALRATGSAAPGTLTARRFLRRWTDARPQFAVTVEYSTPVGPRRVEAHLVASTGYLPAEGTPLIVRYRLQDDPARVLIELDPNRPPLLDPEPWRYSEPREPAG